MSWLFLCPLFGQKGMLMTQLEREIRELSIPELFQAYHPNSHVFIRHYGISKKDLINRIRKIPYKKDEIACASKFLISEENDRDKQKISEMVSQCLLKHQKGIEKWIKTDPFHAFEICEKFPQPIGEGIVKGTDWNVMFPMSNLRIVLKNSDIKGRLFQVMTAYPVPGYDEVDDILDAMEEWENQLDERD